MDEKQKNFNIEDIIKKQRDFFKTGKTKDPDFRVMQLQKLRNSINSNEALLLDALKKDLNKSTFEAYTSEVGFALNDIDFMIKNLKSFAKPVKVKTPPAYLGGKSFIISEPYGEALIIGPWNYPFQLIISPLVGSIAGGNCSILKPSRSAPETYKAIEKVISDAFDEDYIYVVKNGSIKSSELLTHRYDFIFFTGGPTVGKLVMEAASKFLTPVTLELGGKSPCIVDKDTKIEYAAKRIVWGKYLNSGQTCVAPDYLMVHKDVKEELLNKMKEAIKEFYGSNPKESNCYGRIISKKHFDRLENLLKQGKIVTGGNTDAGSLYIEPTIIEDVSLEDEIMTDEIFGPILPVIEFENIDEVIEFVNHREKPLALYFFSNSESNIEKVVTGTSSGGVSVNDTISHMTTSYLPFGGVGQSGMGNYHGKASFDTFSHKKSVLKNQMNFDLKQKYPPYNMGLKKIRKLMKFV